MNTLCTPYLYYIQINLQQSIQMLIYRAYIHIHNSLGNSNSLTIFSEPLMSVSI